MNTSHPSEINIINQFFFGKIVPFDVRNGQAMNYISYKIKHCLQAYDRCENTLLLKGGQ